VKFAKSQKGIVTAEDIEREITPKTKLISVSLVQFLTGYKIDLERLGKICREKEIILSVDAIQGAGSVDIDVQKANVDFLAGGSHKWLMALQGLSYFYLSEELLERIKPKYVGWTSVKKAWNLLDYNLELRDDATRFQNGTLSAIGVTALGASLETLHGFGFHNVIEKIKGNTAYFRRKLDELAIHYSAKDCAEESYSGIVSIILEQPDRKFIKLKQNSIKAAFREGHIRFSPHFYNTKNEIDAVIEILKEING
jgi:selenocysteine lyase/cysteine desulfurase